MRTNKLLSIMVFAQNKVPMNSEEFAGEYLLKKFRLKDSDIERYEEEIKNGGNSRYLSLRKMSQLESYHTPDYVISDDVNDSLEDILFVDVSGPKGGLLTKTEIELDKEIARIQSKMSVGQTRSVELSKQVKPLIQGVKSKLIKINKKYACNRDYKGSISPNNGIVYCMEEGRVPEHHKNTMHNLGAFQLSITTLELLDLLSSGKCQFNDIEQLGLNRPVVFEFNELYKNISFIAFVGRETLENQSYIFVNSEFLRCSNNILAQAIKKMPYVNGNGFRSTRCPKSKLLIDINLSEITEENPYVFPYGNINYKGNAMLGADVPLEEIELSKIHQQFNDGFSK
ncbi:hypothetical protein L1D29_00420 [Shewanella insulae]|uniref:hypothetical protein n=1 Tax=Shewanella insulae TaxID=2681496 RepID=UPI001EFD14D4|nr:hypothetical protein [Shewanella insulae]MCG9711283.1 hypothetical protein [Shewanella insulae]